MDPLSRQWAPVVVLSALTVLIDLNLTLQWVAPYSNVGLALSTLSPVLVAAATLKAVRPETRTLAVAGLSLWGWAASIFGILFGTAMASAYWDGTNQARGVPLVGPLLESVLFLLCVGGSFALLFAACGAACRRYPRWPVYAVTAVLTPVAGLIGYFLHGLR